MSFAYSSVVNNDYRLRGNRIALNSFSQSTLHIKSNFTFILLHLQLLSMQEAVYMVMGGHLNNSLMLLISQCVRP
jgi:hypothetical protein